MQVTQGDNKFLAIRPFRCHRILQFDESAAEAQEESACDNNPPEQTCRSLGQGTPMLNANFRFWRFFLVAQASGSGASCPFGLRPVQAQSSLSPRRVTASVGKRRRNLRRHRRRGLHPLHVAPAEFAYWIEELSYSRVIVSIRPDPPRSGIPLAELTRMSRSVITVLRPFELTSSRTQSEVLATCAGLHQQRRRAIDDLPDDDRLC